MSEGKLKKDIEAKQCWIGPDTYEIAMIEVDDVENFIDSAKAEFPPEKGPTGTKYADHERIASIDKWYKKWLGSPLPNEKSPHGENSNE
jgi:hypothetical protein